MVARLVVEVCAVWAVVVAGASSRGLKLKARGGRAAPGPSRRAFAAAGTVARGGGGVDHVVPGPGAAPTALTLRQHALAGALARAIAQSAVHPLNVCKTVLQSHGGYEALRGGVSGGLFAASTLGFLTRGMGAQALLSLPNGAINFCAMEGARRCLVGSLGALPGGGRFLPRPFVDALSASVGTVLSTLVSLPQSILNDRIMSGRYPNLAVAARDVGLKGLWPRRTWTAALCAKVPAYSLNWVFYQQLRRARLGDLPRGEQDLDASTDVLLGAAAASISVCLMIPLDTVKVRMTTNNLGRVPYASVADAVRRMLAEEGVVAFYRGLPPRLLSVVPMTAIQFAAYECGKRHIPRAEAALATAWRAATAALLRKTAAVRDLGV